MKTDDRDAFEKIVAKEFETNYIKKISNEETFLNERIKDFKAVLSIRDGIILCGPSLSGKTQVVRKFKEEHTEWLTYTIFHDTLHIEELYGKLDMTTKLWKDGIFTKIARTHAN